MLVLVDCPGDGYFLSLSRGQGSPEPVLGAAWSRGRCTQCPRELSPPLPGLTKYRTQQVRFRVTC